eukprot:scaffold23881_cov20-Tisochrysis_lutea.AAC.1
MCSRGESDGIAWAAMALVVHNRGGPDVLERALMGLMDWLRTMCSRQTSTNTRPGQNWSNTVGISPVGRNTRREQASSVKTGDFNALHLGPPVCSPGKCALLSGGLGSPARNIMQADGIVRGSPARNLAEMLAQEQAAIMSQVCVRLFAGLGASVCVCACEREIERERERERERDGNVCAVLRTAATMSNLEGCMKRYLRLRAACALVELGRSNEPMEQLTGELIYLLLRHHNYVVLHICNNRQQRWQGSIVVHTATEHEQV